MVKLSAAFSSLQKFSCVDFQALYTALDIPVWQKRVEKLVFMCFSSACSVIKPGSCCFLQTICGWQQTIWASSRCFLLVFHMTVRMPNMWKLFSGKRCNGELWLLLCSTHFAQISWGSPFVPRMVIQSLGGKEGRTQLMPVGFELGNKYLKCTLVRVHLAFLTFLCNLRTIWQPSFLCSALLWDMATLIYFILK